uniref:Uncharacterized protein n=1 Tax=Vitrella brassicaformis TaxID=1169539 RepID=A0A7S1JMF7_9ALVE|mmetsp:Transcript_15503/g.36937  ORF Transcript_15503/g.36937 Transcript_15503/m.36937 type:complete len:138 (+) Transcript_15503:58-471(+)
MPSIAPTAKQTRHQSNTPHTNPIARLPCLAPTQQRERTIVHRKHHRKNSNWMGSYTHTHTHTLRLLTYTQTDRETDAFREPSVCVFVSLSVLQALLETSDRQTDIQAGRPMYVKEERESSQPVCFSFVGLLVRGAVG